MFVKKILEWKAQLLWLSFVIVLLVTGYHYIRNDAVSEYKKEEKEKIVEVVNERKEENANNEINVVKSSSDDLRDSLRRDSSEGSVSVGLETPNLLQQGSGRYGSPGLGADSFEQQEQSDSVQDLCKPSEVEVYYPDNTYSCESFE